MCSATGLHGIHIVCYQQAISQWRYHVDVSIIRVRVWKEPSWAANFVDNAIVPDLPLLVLITMQVYVQPRVVKPTEYIVDRIPDSDPEETDECMPICQ